MKRIIGILLITMLFLGCGSKKENQMNVGFDGEVFVVTIEGHKYIIYDAYHAGGIVHAESCKCKK